MIPFRRTSQKSVTGEDLGVHALTHIIYTSEFGYSFRHHDNLGKACHGPCPHLRDILVHSNLMIRLREREREISPW